MTNRYDVVAGKNAVREILLSGQPVQEVLFYGKLDPEIEKEARHSHIDLRRVSRDELQGLAPKHQNVVALAHKPIRQLELDELLQLAREDERQPPLLVMTDGIQDPRNLGAAVRVADAAGSHGLILPKRRAAPPTTTVIRAAAGATAHYPLVSVTNLNRSMEACKASGLWIAGLDARGEQTIWEADLTGPLVIVLGSEHKGLRRLVRKACDFTLSIPMFGGVSSLNTSTALAVALYEVRRQRVKSYPSMS